MFQIKQNEATAVRRRIPILLVDITDGFTPETAITAPTINVSKNGAAIASGAGTFAEIGNGQYYYEFTAGEVDTLGWICVNAEKATVSRDYNAVVQVMAYDPMDIVRLGLTSIPNFAQGASGALPTGNATGQVTVATNNDKTGYALSATQTFNVTGNITGNVSGSVGSVTGAVGSVTGNVNGSVASVVGAVGSVTGAVGSVTGNVAGNVTGSVGSLTATAVQNIWDDATVNNTVVGSVGKLIVDNLNAPVGNNTPTLVWSNATRVLTAGTNIVLAKGTGITGFNDITTANIWSEALPGTYTSGQAGFKLNAAGSAADPWSTALPGAYSAGSAGNIIGNRLDTNVGSRMATFTYTTPPTSVAIATQVWSEALPGVYSAGSAGNIIGNVVANTWAAGTRTLTAGTNIVLAKNTGITGFNDITALSVWDILASTVSVVSSMGLQLKTNIDATISSRSTATAVSNISTVTTKLDTAMQLDGAVYQFTVNALELAPSGGGGGGTTTVIANGPYSVIGDGFGANDALDVQQSTAQSVVLRCVDANGSGIPLSSATLSVIVYNAGGTAVVTYTGTAVYAADGWLTFDLTTVVTATVGTYTVIVRRSTSASDTSIYGPLRMYVRGI